MLAVIGMDNTAGDLPIRKPQLEGFIESDIASGIIFIGDGEYELVTWLFLGWQDVHGLGLGYRLERLVLLLPKRHHG